MLYAKRHPMTGCIEVLNSAGFCITTFSRGADGRLAYNAFHKGMAGILPIEETQELQDERARVAAGGFWS